MKKIQINSIDTVIWIVAILVMLLLNINFKTGKIDIGWSLAIILSAYLISSIQGYFLPRLMQQARDWTVQRTLGLYAIFSLVVALVVGNSTLTFMLWYKNIKVSYGNYVTNSLIYTLMTFAFSSVYMIQAFTSRWKASLLKEKELSQALLKAEYDTLKNQVNPHFLFNSLNILSALIPEDPENAVNLVERLSKVFRYNLQNNDRVTVELGTELKIVEAYLFIHKMRFGAHLQCEITIAQEELSRQIVTQGLLTLVENAIKHNECSSEKPLKIAVFVENNFVVVSNSFQPKNKQFLESTGIGLRNLKSRYDLLTSQKVEIIETETFFEVKIPLL
ncbi:MAG: histidine kinase [Spirosomataceae bacterium]